MNKYNLLINDEIGVESSATDQLQFVASLPHVLFASGLPDIHPGPHAPIGATVISKEQFYPTLIGTDIGCGMNLTSLDIDPNKINLKNLKSKLPLLESHDPTFIPKNFKLPFEDSLGTIGGGNHFTELLSLETSYISDSESYNNLNQVINRDKVFILTHSGSRGYGAHIIKDILSKLTPGSSASLSDNSNLGQEYIQNHNQALEWAATNRSIISNRFCKALTSESSLIVDHPHNYLSKETINGKELWVHRKGTNSSHQKLVVIPGSRGHYSYLVEPLPNNPYSYSLPHGAGRKWTRGSVKSKVGQTAKELQITKLGSHIVCKNKKTLFEEAPNAYKNIDAIIELLEEKKLIKVIAKFKPILTYKTQTPENKYAKK